MRKNKAFFFTGITGPTGHLFLTGNKPKTGDYQNLFDSIPFILDPGDSAKENKSGHIRLESDIRSAERLLPLADGFARAVQSHQLPIVRNNNLMSEVIINSSTHNGITIEEVNYANGANIRRDFVIKNAFSLISPLGSVVLVPMAGGYRIDVAPGVSDTYKIMTDGADTTPDYINSKIGNGLSVNVGTHKLFVLLDPAPATDIVLSSSAAGLNATLNHVDTNTIQLFTGVGGLYGNLRYNGTWFTEDAGTGLRLLPHGITQNEIALGTLLGTNVNVTPGQFFGDGLNHDGTRIYARVHKSLRLDPTGGANIKPIELVGDLAAPGANMYYGTDGAGNKGWFTTIPFLDSPWEYTDSDTSVFVKNTFSESRAPYAVASGYNSNPWIAGSLGNAAGSWTQSMKVMMRGSISVPGTCNLNTADSRLLWIPEDSVAFIKGTAIAQDIATNDMAVYKFSFTAKNIAGVVSVSDILYDTTVAPFHVVQAGVIPYATEYTADITPDFYIYAAGNKIRLDGFGITGKSLHWTCELDIHVNGGSTFVVPVYVP